MVTYFKGCSSVSEVNATLLHIFNTKYTDSSKRDSTYEKILKEHMYLVCTTDDIRKVCGGDFYPIEKPEEPIHDNTKKWLTKLAYAIEHNGGKIGSLYFKYLKEMESLNVKPKREDLELIAKLCGYSKGWVHYKELELKLK